MIIELSKFVLPTLKSMDVGINEYEFNPIIIDYSKLSNSTLLEIANLDN